MPTTEHPDAGTTQESGRDWPLDEVAVRALVDAAPDGILMSDHDGRILFANRQAEMQFGFAPGELACRSVDDLLPERLREAHRVHRARYGAEPRLRAMGAGLRLCGRRADGSEFPVEISLSPLRDDTGVRVVAVIRDVTDRVMAEERLRRAEQHLRIIEDRDRIARDLHDIVIQKLFAAGMNIQSVAARTDADQAARLNAVVDELDDTIREIRSVIFGLHSDLRDGTGVRAEILHICDDHRDALGFEPRIRFEGPVDAMSDQVAAELLPVVREAISNVARHAGASVAELTVEHAGDFVTLRVIDNGRGVPADPPEGRGLQNLAERATRLGGRCFVSPRPEGGTLVEWQVPTVG
jgi:two-component system, NarL family, sensor histidine kinase DevS